MRMKEVPMRDAQLKLDHNLQIATNNQYVLHYDLFSNPRDTSTLIHLLNSSTFLYKFDYVVCRLWQWEQL